MASAEEDGTEPPRFDIRLTVPTCHRSLTLINYTLCEQLEGAGAILINDGPLPLVLSAQVNLLCFYQKIVHFRPFRFAVFMRMGLLVLDLLILVALF